MKISNESIPPDLTTKPAASPTSSRRSEGTADGSSVEDSAEVSSLGKLVARLEDQSATKIEQLRAKLRSGNYSVDAGELSKKVIDSMLGK